MVVEAILLWGSPEAERGRLEGHRGTEEGSKHEGAKGRV